MTIPAPLYFRGGPKDGEIVRDASQNFAPSEITFRDHPAGKYVYDETSSTPGYRWVEKPAL